MKIQIVDIYESLGTLVDIDFSASTLQFNRTLLILIPSESGSPAMPTISMFYGILIQMYWDEHAPPHFHAVYADFKATIDIRNLSISEGSLPRRATQLVLDWAELR